MSLSQSTLQKINGFVSALQSVFEQKSNKVTSISSNSTDTQYPSAKVVYDQLDGKVSINQGASNNGKFLKVSNGNVVCETVSLSGSGMTIDRIHRSNNLNDYISLGFYYIDSSDLDYVTNVPSVTSGDTNAILFVEAVADEYIKQTISFDEDIYVRFYNDYEVSWSNWIDIRNPKSHTGLGYGGGTSSTYGHVKLSDTYKSDGSSASNSIGASTKAVVDLYNDFATHKHDDILHIVIRNDMEFLTLNFATGMGIYSCFQPTVTPTGVNSWKNYLDLNTVISNSGYNMSGKVIKSYGTSWVHVDAILGVDMRFRVDGGNVYYWATDSNQSIIHSFSIPFFFKLVDAE